MFCFVFYCKFQIFQLFAVFCFMSKWHSTKRKIIYFFLNLNGNNWRFGEDLEEICGGKNKSLRETLKIQQWKESSGLMAIDKTVVLSLGRDLLILHLYLKFSLTIDAYWNLNFKFKMQWRGKVCLNRVFENSECNIAEYGIWVYQLHIWINQPKAGLEYLILSAWKVKMVFWRTLYPL